QRHQEARLQAREDDHEDQQENQRRKLAEQGEHPGAGQAVCRADAHGRGSLISGSHQSCRVMLAMSSSAVTSAAVCSEVVSPSRSVMILSERDITSGISEEISSTATPSAAI